ncbi:NAD-dependent succinate-semialdehyde dehydrogenase [Alcanivorax sp. N3-2A]|nr:NAD-dependent succinate-semialdehyde dehydrogenase [Alcanivorax sp. N3-2A]|tara:strand:- start:10536 stop:11981 length:1446 start_codon:yes stop_codon:yes gene_type:complete
MNEHRYPAPRLWIDGDWLDGAGRADQAVINPASGAELGRLPHAGPADIERALHAAEGAFESWRRTSPVARSEVLRRTAALIREGRDTLARLISLELGKPLAEARAETETAAEMFEWAAEEGRRAYGRVIPERSPGLRMMALPEPVGPVMAVAGWNAPAITPSRKIAGALAAGCSIIIKPSEGTPATALFLARALEQAGLPAGVVNMVFGDPVAICEQLLSSPVIRMITFTGSTPVGKQLAARATATMKRMVFELGGHAPALVFPDVDLDAVVKGAVATKFRNSGQVCTSPTRFYVHQSIHDQFVEAFVKHAAAITPGDPLAAGTGMGPVQNARRLDALEALVADAREHGATVATGGQRRAGAGFFFPPTVLTGVGPQCRVVNEEPFGPLAMITPFADLDEAIGQANRLPLGLASYAFSNDLRVVDRLSREIRCGNVIINHWKVSFPETPFGGVLDSGVGLEGGIEGLQAFQQIKFVSQAAQ